MNKKLYTLIALVCVMLLSGPLQAQKSTLKGNGQVFFHEEFDWENPADPKGWTMTEGYILIDPDDIGYNWRWMPYDSLVSTFTAEPPFESSSHENGYLGLFLNKYNEALPDNGRLTVNNSIQFPHFDFSDKTSVVLSFEMHSMNGGPGLQEVLISSDNGAHWAVYNCGFGVNHKDRPNDVAPGQPAIFEANITDVAAGMSDVIIQIHWGATTLYFWVLDDFKLSEAYDNDLKLTHFTAEWDNDEPDNQMSSIFMIPKSQLNGIGGFLNWEATVLNFGEFDQEDVYLDLSVTKNNAVVWQRETEKLFTLGTLNIDTARVADKYTPEEFGHYKVTYNFKTALPENTPENNKAEFFFHVNDSVYSRSDDTPDLAWSYLFERYGAADQMACEDYFTGSIFPIYGDCEVSSISTYIMGGLADGKIEFQFQLWLVPEDDPTPVKWLTTEMQILDSSMFNTWVTMPIEKDGESEFLFAGDLVYVGISQWDYHEDNLVRRAKGLKIGHDRTVKMVAPSAVGLYNGNIELGLSTFVRRNLMCRLNINDHSNINDGVDVTAAQSHLDQNYPNPFSSTTQISYELASGGEVSIQVMDLTGRKVMDLNEGRKPAGKHTLTLDATGLEAGMYYFTLQAGNFRETKQMVVF